MNRTIYIEGSTIGPNSKALQTQAREGVRKLLERTGLFVGRMPKLVVCGGRTSAYKDFLSAYSLAEAGDYVGLLVDSEDPIANISKPWAHLLQRENWRPPVGAADDHALLMTTCIETLVVADQATLKSHYGANLQLSALPSLVDLESRNRHVVQEALVHATRDCKNKYQKGQRSFEILGKLDPIVLRQHLPSFDRLLNVLNDRL